MNNLRYLVYDGNGRVSTEAKLPRGVCFYLTTGEWLYKRGRFNIGSGIRVNDDNNLLPGVVFVFDWTNVQHRHKAAVIAHDVKKYGRLFNA